MRWYHLGIAVVVLLSGCTSERDRIAPIVLPNVVVTVCALSPSHHYLIAYTADPGQNPYQGRYQAQVFDLTTMLAIPLPIDRNATEQPELRWYPDDVLWVDQRWLYDIPNGIVTDTTTVLHPLPPSPYNGEVPQWYPSPDRRYVANGAQIWFRDPVTGDRGTMIIDLPSTIYTDGCSYGWSADSRSYYFVDWVMTGPRHAEPGPIRRITLP